MRQQRLASVLRQAVAAHRAPALARPTPCTTINLAARCLSTQPATRDRQPAYGTLFATAAGIAAGLGVWHWYEVQCEAPASPKQLPVFSKEEVAKHKTREQGVWVTFKGGVYDVTEWLDLHPGGAARVMLAAGSSLEPFWSMYQQHNHPNVINILEAYRIGNLEGGAVKEEYADPYADEPARNPALVVRSEKPFNAETPKELLTARLLTTNELFYVRNHLPTPDLDASSYKLRIEGEGMRITELSLEDLKAKFKKHSVVSTIQCSGNRREQLNQVKEIKGLRWDVGAVGTAEWSGVRLRDVLRYAGLDEGSVDVQHIWFEGADTDKTSGSTYGASIPLDKAISSQGEVILAYEMNGEPLPRDHGFPVRVVVPGTTGARSVKWLSKISASAEESPSHWQQKDYKSFSPNTDWDNVDWDSAPAIQSMPVTSAICEPSEGAVLEEGTDEITVRGYAWSGGGQRIVRVDVSPDNGATWHTADLTSAGQKQGQAWGWTLFEATVPLPPGSKGEVQLVCKATDQAYNTQPERPEPIWNLRGVANNAWHRVTVKVEE